MAEYVSAKDIVIKVGSLVVGCAQAASFKVSRELKDIVCAASGAWSEKIPGQMSWESSISGVVRAFTVAEEGTNVTFDTLFDKLKNGSLVTLEYSYDLDGLQGKRYSGSAYVSELSWDKPEKDEVTWSASFSGNGPLTSEVIA